MINILVVEDSEKLRHLISMRLKTAGYHVLEACNGLEALDILEETSIHLIVADIMMPEMDGYELTRELRNAGDYTPILMMTARETLEDKRQGFESGVDDYMVKPVDSEELLLRVQALLRRSKIAASNLLMVGNTTLDTEKLMVADQSQSFYLPQKEFQLLHTLLSYPDKIFTRYALMDEIWGYDTETDPRTVDVHIKRLRDKFADSPDFAIETVRGLGYKGVHKN